MKIVFMSVGSRGDIEPFLALAILFRERGHEVICLFPEQFRAMTAEHDITFESFGPEFLDMILSEDAKEIISGKASFFRKLKIVYKMYKSSGGIQHKIMRIQKEVLQKHSPDRVVYHPKCLFGLIWELAYPGSTIMQSPLPCITHPVDEISALGFGENRNYGTLLNRFTYWLTNSIRLRVFASFTKKYKSGLPLADYGIRKMRRVMLKTGKAIYTFSPTLFAEPPNWPAQVKVVGYYERSKTSNWEPGPDLLDFLATHSDIVFITFGSMTNSDPEVKTSIILNALVKHKIPAIINTSLGGLKKPDNFPEHVFFVDNIPYEWIFPKVTAVVHHGGSGTTHTSIKHGCASLVIPHFVDQFMWNRINSELGAGPKGVSIKKLDEYLFERLLSDLIGTPAYKTNAEKLAKKMKAEDLSDLLFELIEQPPD